jgi:hypothetical protein
VNKWRCNPQKDRKYDSGTESADQGGGGRSIASLGRELERRSGLLPQLTWEADQNPRCSSATGNYDSGLMCWMVITLVTELGSSSA